MNISRCAAPFLAASRRALAIAATHRVAHRHSADPINEKTAATNQVVPASASDHPGGPVGRRVLRPALGVATGRDPDGRQRRNSDTAGSVSAARPPLGRIARITRVVAVPMVAVAALVGATGSAHAATSAVGQIGASVYCYSDTYHHTAQIGVYPYARENSQPQVRQPGRGLSVRVLHRSRLRLVRVERGDVGERRLLDNRRQRRAHGDYWLGPPPVGVVERCPRWWPDRGYIRARRLLERDGL